MVPRFEPIHLEAGDGLTGRRFAVLHHGVGAVRGAVVLAPALFEEMNKARRATAVAAQALAAAGFHVLRPDLHGCGDSDGDIAQASWDGWIGDIAAATRWLAARAGSSPWLWGVRGGALLASAAASRLAMRAPLLLWQPVQQGRSVLQNLVRLRLAADGGGKDAADRLRSEWDAGRAVEVAGYRVPGAVARGLGDAVLALPEGTPRVAWLEVANRAEPALLPASVTCTEAWRGRGALVHSQATVGPQFWQTVEIEEAPALVEATVASLMQAGVGP